MSHEYQITLYEHTITIVQLDVDVSSVKLDRVYNDHSFGTRFYCTDDRFQLLRRNHVFLVNADHVRCVRGVWYTKLPGDVKESHLQKCYGLQDFNDHLRHVWWCLRRIPEDIARRVMEFTFLG